MSLNQGQILDHNNERVMNTYIHTPKNSSDNVVCVCSVCKQCVTKALGSSGMYPVPDERPHESGSILSGLGCEACIGVRPASSIVAGK